MALPWALRGLRNGIVTSRYPANRDDYFDAFPATVDVTHTADATRLAHQAASQAVLDQICPTRALVSSGAPEPRVTVDRGACIGCGRCVDAIPGLFAWRRGADTAAPTRSALVVPHAEGTLEEIERVRADLATRVKALRRSVHLRHVDAGSDGSDEWEIQALLNPVYDIHRLGIFFTASPRHADILLVTGIGSAGMRAPLERTREAMPDPVVVIAVGSDAASGGLFGGGYASSGGVGDLLDVDVWVPGSPASPFSILHGILLALDRLPAPPQDARSTGSAGEAR